MEKLTMWHKVTDFDTWKQHYDADAPMREEMGMNEVSLRRFTLDPNTFIVTFEGEGMMGKLNTLLSSPDSQEKMKAAGVEKMDFMIYM